MFTQKNGYASLGMYDLYINLGATPVLTGTIPREAPRYHTDSVIFRPDGWPLPPDVDPDGFMVDVSYLDPIHPSSPPIPCILSDGTGRPVSPADVARLVNEYAYKKRK